MPGLSFLNIAFLAGLAAAALPILIHLFSRRKAPRLEWGSTRFLRELNRQRIRRVKLRQLLLLAVRALAIILFALAMGRPALTGGRVPGGKAPSTAVILLDTSYSMSAARGGELTFELARRRIGEIIDLLAEGDEVYLVTVGGEAESFTPYAVQDFGLIREHLGKLTPGFRAGSMEEGLALAGRLLQDSKNLNRELYVVSDLQRSAWSGFTDSTTAGFGLPEDTAVCVMGLGGESIDNLAIDDVQVERGAGSRHFALDVTISNHTGKPQRGIPVRATVGDRPAGEVVTQLEAGATTRVRLDLGAGPWSEAFGEVEIPEDALPVDDRRHFVLAEQERAGVGIVADLESAGTQSGAEFVRLALAPDPASSPFSVTMIPAQAMGAADLSALSVVIVAGASQLERDAVEELKEFVRNGGGLIIFPGEHSDLRAYNDRLLPSLLPIKLAGVVETAGREAAGGGAAGGGASGDAKRGDGRGFVLTPTVSGHPVFQGFTAERGERLTQARFNKVVRVVPGPGRVIAQFGPDLPALIEGQRVLFFASSLDQSWNDLPTSAAFVPMLHQAVSYLARGAAESGSVFAGGRVERSIPAPSVPGHYQMSGPGGEVMPIEAVERGRSIALRSAPVERPGIYRITDQNGADAALAAVNVDTRESDLALIDRADVERMFGRRPFSFLDGGRQVTTHVRELRQGRELWRPILLLALAVLVIEVLLSRGKGAFTPAAS